MADDRDQRVRQRAYELWEKEGKQPGREREHWEQAEREVGGKGAGKAAGTKPVGAKPKAAGAKPKASKPAGGRSKKG